MSNSPNTPTTRPPEQMHTQVDRIMAHLFALHAALDDATPGDLRAAFKHCVNLRDDGQHVRLGRRFWEDAALLVRSQGT